MADIETLGVLEEIQSLVLDNLQVVSYKWLSRNFLVSSNDAKRLLQECVEKFGAGLQVVYTLSGWLKNDPSTYHIRLVPGPRLSEAKKDFDGNCSVQVYSVQACLPKDPAVLWNAEFVQAEELFKQPFGMDNCLRDNRFCGVSNSFVKRNAGGTCASTITSLEKSSGALEQSKKPSMHNNPAIHLAPQKVVQKSSTNISSHSLSLDKDAKSDNQRKEKHEQCIKLAEKTENVHQVPVNKRNVPNDKSSSGTGSALANMWGRASAKPKVESVSASINNVLPNTTVSANAQICAPEEMVQKGSDDEGEGLSHRRRSNGEGTRKRRVVFDYSDDEDELNDAVNLSSPDPPKKQAVIFSKHTSKSSDLGKANLDLEDENVNEADDKGVKEAKTKSKQTSRDGKECSAFAKECSALSESNKTKTSSLEKNLKDTSAFDKNTNDKMTETAPKSPKRRKVLKTRIDERGREVTEVVWEGEEPEAKPEADTIRKADTNIAKNAANRPSGVKKTHPGGAPAPLNQTGKAANKKAGNIDPKQGNIMSFFKRV